MNDLFNDARFSALRSMPQFTEAMFNRIIEFQEKKHLAWNENAAFLERIAQLPLHYFIFSNYDRDPDTQGPTLAHYYPLKEEMHKLAYYLDCADCREIVDYYPGNGLIGSLLARAAGLNAVGLAFNNHKPSQIEHFYDRDRYRMLQHREIFQTAPEQAYFVSWTPSGCNPVDEILRQKPRLIIFVGSEHRNEENGERQVGVANMYQTLQDSYQLWDQWEITRAENLLHKIWPDMTPNIEETRQVYVFANKSVASPHDEPLNDEQAKPNEGYFWESELRMAELAAEAMKTLQGMNLPI